MAETNHGDARDPQNEMLLWVKAAVIPQVKTRVDQTLSATPERKAYNAADGSKTNTELAAIAGKSKQLVSKWSKKWRQLGIASLTPDGHLRHLQSLEAFGLPIEAGADGDEE